MHRQNEGLREQNDRLINLNERLMTETEALRLEISKLRQMFGERANSFDGHNASIQQLQERISKLQGTTEEQMRNTSLLEQDNFRMKKRVEEYESNIRRLTEQNQTLVTRLDDVSRDKTDFSVLHSLKQENQDLRQTMNTLRNAVASNERQVKDYLAQIEETNARYSNLNRDYQRLMEDYNRLRLAVQSPSKALDESTRNRMSQLEQENASLNDIVLDLRNRTRKAQVDFEAKDKEALLLKEEVRQLQAIISSKNAESLRPADSGREKQDLIAMNSQLSNKLRDVMSDNAALGRRVKDYESRITSLTQEVEVARLSGLRLPKDAVRGLRSLFVRYFQSAEQDRRVADKLNQDALSITNSLSRSIEQSAAPGRDAQVKELMVDLVQRLVSFSEGDFMNRSDIQRDSTLAEETITKLLDTLEKNGLDQAPAAPRETVLSTAPRRDSRFRIHEMDQDNSEMIATIIEHETGITNRDRVRVEKNRLEDTYDCSLVEFVPDDRAVHGQHRRTRLIRIPAAIVDDLKEVHVLRDPDPAELASLQGENPAHLLVRERFDHEKKIIEAIRMTEDHDLPAVLASSRVSGGGQTVSFSKAVADKLRPARQNKNPTTGVLMQRQFSNQLGQEFKVISAIISQGLLKKFELKPPKSSKSLVKIEDFDPQTNRTSQEVFFFRTDYQDMRRAMRKDILLNEICARICQDSDPAKTGFDVFRQNENSHELLLEKLVLQRRGDSAAKVSDVYSMDLQKLLEAIDLDASDFRLWLKSQSDRNGRCLLREIELRVVVAGKVPKIDFVTLKEADEPLAPESPLREVLLDPFLQKFLLIAQADALSPASLFIKEKQESSKVVIDAISSLRDNQRQKSSDQVDHLRILRRVVFDPDADVYGRPSLYMEHSDGRRKTTENVLFSDQQQPIKQLVSNDDILTMYGMEGLGVNLESEKLHMFEKTLSRFQKPVVQSVSKALLRNTDLNRSLNLELCELLYFLVSEDTLYLERDAVLRVTSKGKNKVFERIVLQEEAKESSSLPSQRVSAFVADRLTLVDAQNKSSQEWSLQIESTVGKEQAKRMETLSFSKAQWRDVRGVYNFKPNAPRNKAVFELQHQTVSMNDSKGLKRIFLDRLELASSEAETIRRLLAAQRKANRDGFHLLLELVSADLPPSLDFELYAVPQLGINFATLVRRYVRDLPGNLSLEETHQLEASQIKLHAQKGDSDSWLRHTFTICDMSAQDVTSLKLSPERSSEQLTAMTEYKKRAKIKDQEFQTDGQLVVREKLNPHNRDLVIEKLVYRDANRLGLDLPDPLKPFVVDVKLRSFERLKGEVDWEEPKKLDFARVCHGLANLVCLLNEETKQHPFIFMREAEDKLVLEKLVVAVPGTPSGAVVHLAERLTVRLKNSLMTPSNELIQPSDLKIVKETFTKHKRHVCTISLSESVGIPLVNSKLKKSVDEFEVYEDAGNPPSISTLFRSLEPSALAMLFRFLYESHKLGSHYVIKEPARVEASRFNFQKIHLFEASDSKNILDQLFEKFTFTPNKNQLAEISRRIIEFNTLIEESLAIRSPSESEKTHHSLQDSAAPLPGEELLKQRVSYSDNVVTRSPSLPAVDHAIESDFVYKTDVKPELEDGLNALFEIKTPQTLAGHGSYLIWETKDPSRSVFRRIRCDQQADGSFRAELLEKVEVKKDEVLASVMKKIPDKLFQSNSGSKIASISERDERGCLYSYFVKESFDHQLNQKVIRRIKVNEDSFSTGSPTLPRLSVVQEETVRGIDPKERQAVQLFVNFITKVFKNHQLLMRSNSIVGEEVRGDVVTFERKDVYLEDEDEEDPVYTAYVREAVDVDVRASLLQPDSPEASTAGGVRYGNKNRNQQIESISIERTLGDFHIKVLDRIVIEEDSLRKDLPLEEASLNPALAATLKFHKASADGVLSNRLALVEELGLGQAVFIIGLSADADWNLNLLNPLDHRPPGFLVTVEEKFFIDNSLPLMQVYSVVNSMLGRDSQLTHDVKREYMLNAKQAVSEQLQLTEDGERVRHKLLAKSESPLVFEDWLSPVDNLVLAKIFGISLGGTNDIIIRRVREKSGVVFEKIKFAPQRIGNEFSILERICIDEDSQFSSLESPAVGEVFPMSNFEDFARVGHISKQKVDREGKPLFEVLEFNDHMALPAEDQHSKDNLFIMVQNPVIQKGIPQVLDRTSLNEFSPVDVKLMDVVSQRLIRLLLENDPGRKLEFAIVISHDQSSAVVGKKIAVKQFEADLTLATVTGDRSPNSSSYERDIFNPAERTRLKQKIQLVQEQTNVLASQKESFSPANPAVLKQNVFEAEFFISYLTRFYNGLKGGNNYIKRSEDSARVVFEVWEMLPGNTECLRESTEVAKRPDASGKTRINRRSFNRNSQIEEYIECEPSRVQSSDQIEPRFTKIFQVKPTSVYKGDIQPSKPEEKLLRKHPFDFESALNAYLSEPFTHNYIVSQRSTEDEKLVEKILVDRNRDSKVVDRFILQRADLARRLMHGSELSPQAAAVFKSIGVEGVEGIAKVLGLPQSDAVFYVRLIQRSGQNIRQLIKLLKNDSDPKTGELARLGSRLMRSDEYRGEIEPYLQSTNSIKDYITNNNEIEYVVIKETELNDHLDDYMLHSEVVGYCIHSNPIFRGQIQNLQPDSNNINFEVMQRLDALNRMLTDKQSEVQRLEAIVRDLSSRKSNSANTDLLIQENQTLTIRLENTQKELRQTKTELEQIYVKYQAILQEFTLLKAKLEDIDHLEAQNADLYKQLDILKKRLDDEVMMRRNLESDRDSLLKQLQDLRLKMSNDSSTQDALNEVGRLKTANMSLTNEVDSLRREVSEYTKRIQEITLLLQKVEKERDGLKLALEQNDNRQYLDKIQDLERDLDKLRKENGAYSSRISLLVTEVDTMKTTINTQQDQLRSREVRTEAPLRSSKDDKATKDMEEKIAKMTTEISSLRTELRLKDEKIAGLDSLVQSLRVSHSTTEVKVSSNYDEIALQELRRKNDSLMQEVSRLKLQLAERDSAEKRPIRQSPGRNPQKLLLTTITGVKFEGSGGRVTESTQQVANFTRTTLEVPQRTAPDELSFEADTDSELFHRYTILHRQYTDLFSEIEALKNENNRLKSDIITLSGKNLDPDLVALNRKPSSLSHAQDQRSLPQLEDQKLRRRTETRRSSHRTHDLQPPQHHSGQPNESPGRLGRPQSSLGQSHKERDRQLGHRALPVRSELEDP